MNNCSKHFIKYLPIPLNLQIVFSNYWYVSFCMSKLLIGYIVADRYTYSLLLEWKGI